MNVFLLVLAFYMLLMSIVLKPNNTLSIVTITLPILLSACVLCAYGLRGLGGLNF